MFSKLRGRLTYANVTSSIALCFALGTGGAYAANTIGSSDIIDNEIRTADVRDDTVSGGGLGSIDIANGEMTTNEIRDDSQPFGGLFAQDLAAGSVGTSELQNNSVNGTDIQDLTITTNDVAANTFTSADLATGSVGAAEVQDDSLDLFDIKEETLNLPQVRTQAAFALGTSATNTADSFTKVTGKNVPAGDYAVVGEAEVPSTGPFEGDIVRDSACEIRGGSVVVGGTSERQVTPDEELTRSSLSMNGISSLPGGGEISLWCRYQGGGAGLSNGQLLIIRLDGRF